MESSHPPEGTVTFLFTDIQGSTQLWQQFPAAMPVALERHHALLRQAIEAHSGYVFQIIGDAFCAAFHTVVDGLGTALQAQRLLWDETWGDTGPLRVRMAIHTGAAEIRVGDYTSGEYVSGLTLSRAARLLSAGHGGQVLLSLPAVDQVRDQLPPGVELLDLGSHRLKDLAQPEQIFQAIAPDLPVEFLALNTLDAHQHNLPVQLTNFIGRETELGTVRHLLLDSESGARLVTLVGLGGVGKTRLAIQAAADLIDEFPDGVWFADLSALTDPELVPDSVAALFNLRAQPWRSIMSMLSDYVSRKKLLIILDNCEHLVEACARLASDLLQAGPGVKLIATSRELLGIPGERLLHLGPLSYPDSLEPMDIQSLTQYEAVQLLIARGQAAHPVFSLNDSNAPAIASICFQLDGIPLAIELAAARLRLLSIEQVNERLADRFRLLTGGSRTAMPRQQTLQATIDWSYNLLSNEERLLFQRLSVFSGGCTLKAVEQVCSGGGIDDSEILEVLAHLVDKSLLSVDLDSGEARYRMLESIRQYAWRVLAENGQAETWQRRHLEAYLVLAEQAEPKLRSGEDLVWLARLAREHDNLRAAIEWALNKGDQRSFLRLCAALYYFWVRRGHYQEGLSYLQSVEDLGELTQFPLETARVLVALGLYRWLAGQFQSGEAVLEKGLQVLRTQGTQERYWLGLGMVYLAATQMRLYAYDTAVEVVHESLAIFEELQDAFGLANINYILGRIYIEQGKMQAARQPSERALEWGQRCGDRYLISLILDSLDLIEVSAGNFASAVELNRRGLKISRELEDPWLLSGMLREAGNLAQIMGELPEAIRFFSESSSLSYQQGLMGDYARTCYNLGVISARQGELLTADQHLTEALSLFKQLDNRRGQAECLDGFALLASVQGQSEKAATLMSAADVEFAHLKLERWPADLLEHKQLLARLVNELEPEKYTQALTRGARLSLEEALDLIQQ